MNRPTIDVDVEQVHEELRDLRRRMFIHWTLRERRRYEELTKRLAKLSRVISQRNKEHEEHQ